MRRLLPPLLGLVGLTLLAAATARAEVLVLVHGYLGNAGSWQDAGVLADLGKADWHWVASNDGNRFTPKADGPKRAKPVYTMQLPSIAPLVLQADLLGRGLAQITERHPDESITLVGHSAGGVVARLALVRHGAGQVRRLITIAAPHLGTPRAEQALDATDSGGMFGMFKNWFARQKMGDGLYDTVRASRGALVDLASPRPGNLLGWLNRQPHPDIHYVSLVRQAGPQPDPVVPAYSQDMNQVPALRGKVKTWSTPSGHELNPRDGRVLRALLAEETTAS